jgi:hypothetical protein
MLNVNASSACFAKRNRNPLRSGTWMPSAVRSGGRMGICELPPFWSGCTDFDGGNIISNS